MNKKRHYLAFSVVLLVVFSFVIVVPGNAQSVTKNFTLKNFNLTLTFPKTANPGDSITVSVSAAATSTVRVKDLSIQILAYVENGDLQPIGSTSLASDRSVYKGDTLSKDVSLTVPTNILRGELVAVVSETISSTSYYTYSPYYYYYYNYNYYPYYYGYYPNYTSYYWYYPYYYTYYYPETYSQNYVESKVLPCTYILATTPEYVKLKSDYDQLSSQYNDISARYQQATEQNNELAAKLDAANQDANNSRILAYAFIAATVVLALLAASFIFMYQRQKTRSTPNSLAPQQPQTVTADATTEKK